ncbi:MAG: laccase domain-containing protein [Bacilli bacterium]|nr:laccase domain-containing protein [Bacilli bacterium]
MDNQLFVNFPLSDKCLALTTTTALGNLAYQVDEGRNVKEHRLLLADLLSIDLNRFVFVHQHHSNKIQKVTLDDLGKGKDSFIDGVDVDALYTYEKNVPLCIFHADCVPIFFIDETRGLVGIIHAGYKGTLIHVAYESIKKVIEDEGVNPNNLKFYVGPYRMPQSFKIDENSRKDIVEAGYQDAIKGDNFDNGLANVIDLRRLGIKDSQISFSNFDTLTDDRFYSAYQKTPVGRLVSLIVLK